MGTKIIKEKEEFLYYFFCTTEVFLLILTVMNLMHPLDIKMEGVVCEYNTLTCNQPITRTQLSTISRVQLRFSRSYYADCKLSDLLQERVQGEAYCARIHVIGARGKYACYSNLPIQ